MPRIIQSDEIANRVSRMCRDACCRLPADLLDAIRAARQSEITDTGRDILDQILENARLAAETDAPSCQDTGMACFFIEMGSEAIIAGATLGDAINEGVRRGYTEGFLRKSIVRHPFQRENTGDNTPAFIHLEQVEGDCLKISFLAKGGGSENMGAFRTMVASAGPNGVRDFVVETVERAGGSPCPPLVIGIGLGGPMEYACMLAKKALLRDVGRPNADPMLAELEEEILDAVNRTGVGPLGLGGAATALAVHVEATGCHITALPVAVNLGCHALRKATIIL
ncbi:MAG TPA: fumarate hydratase [Candidatus Brocadiia bacterium]|nr:fumarate hydratase [Candidatus Brocadiia bacterium]